MMKRIIIAVYVLTSLYLIFNIVPIFAQSKILINEFLIDPQPQSVEIFNSGTESADISDWIIDDSGGTTFYTIPKENIIFPGQCLIYSADLNLNKTSADTVRLINSSQQLIDSFSYKSSSGSGVSFFRSLDGSNDWTTGSANLGFHNQTDITCLTTPTPTVTMAPTTIPIIITPTTTPPLPTETFVPTSIPSLESYDNIYISEIMIDPPTGEKEWVEIYNDNDFSASLKDWFIDDTENSGSSPKIFSLDIGKKSYAVFDLSSSIFNNDGDSVRLLDQKKDLKNSFEYNETEQGKTLGRTSLDSDDFCIQMPTKNYINNSCINTNPAPTSLPPTIKIIQTKTTSTTVDNSDVSIYRDINYPTGIILKSFDKGEVLGVTEELMIDPPDDGSVINLLTILSVSYSLLTISSILFKMKLSYGKDKKFYSSTLHSP